MRFSASVPDDDRLQVVSASLAPGDVLFTLRGSTLASWPRDAHETPTPRLRIDGARAIACIPGSHLLAVVVVRPAGPTGVALFDERFHEAGFVPLGLGSRVAATPTAADSLDVAATRPAIELDPQQVGERIAEHDTCHASASPDGALLAISFAPRDLGQFVPLTRVIDLDHRVALPLEGFSHVHFIGPRRVVAQRAGRPGDVVFADLTLGERDARLEQLKWGPTFAGREIVASDPGSGLFAVMRARPFSTHRFVDVYDANVGRLGGTREPIDWTARFCVTSRE